MGLLKEIDTLILQTLTYCVDKYVLVYCQYLTHCPAKKISGTWNGHLNVKVACK